MNNCRYKKGRSLGQSGFSLIEVLVTMVIVVFGLMGLIGLMLKGLQHNAGSSMRTIATAQAYDMADRMRGNIAGVSAGNYDSVLPPGSSSTCVISVNDHVSPPTPSSLGSCAACSTLCTVSEVAARDTCLWHEANAKLMPSGSGAVCKDVANNWFTIYVSWDDSKSGDTSKTFILRLEP